MERVTRRSRFLAVSAGIALAAGLAGCGVLTDKITPPEKPSITFESNVSAGQDNVTVDTLVRVSATDGTIATVDL